jgi:protein SCO1/2
METLKQVHFVLTGHLTEPVQVVFVSLDHERDNPERIDEFLNAISDEFVGVTGNATALKQFAGNIDNYFKETVISSDNTGIDDNQIEHSTSLVLVNPEAKVVAMLNPPYHVVELHNDIMTIIDDEAGR